MGGVGAVLKGSALPEWATICNVALLLHKWPDEVEDHISPAMIRRLTWLHHQQNTPQQGPMGR